MTKNVDSNELIIKGNLQGENGESLNVIDYAINLRSFDNVVTTFSGDSFVLILTKDQLEYTDQINIEVVSRNIPSHPKIFTFSKEDLMVLNFQISIVFKEVAFLEGMIIGELVPQKKSRRLFRKRN